MNFKIYGFITVRTNSSRLPGKCLLNFNKTNVITHLIRRAKHSKITPIICTTKNKSDNILQKIALKEKIKIFRGSEKNKLKRWRDCCKKFRVKYFHTIDADDPFFDPITIKKSLNLCKKGYDIVNPSKISRSGGASEGWSFSKEAIEEVYKSLFKFNKNIDKFDTEMIEPFIKLKKLKTTTLKGAPYEIKNARITLDYKEDYELLKKIVDKKGSIASRKNINQFLLNNKYLLKINIKKGKDWKKKQNSFEIPRVKI
jgi:spore coat polysaccharide biosynthesis protein SpsF (cytidylyltransferase family)